MTALLDRADSPHFSGLKQFADRELDTWVEGMVIPLSADPTCESVSERWPTEKGRLLKLERVSIEYLQHVHLPYSLRNSMAHELRLLGYGMEMSRDHQPFYMSFTALGSDQNNWELVYPLSFFESLCDTVIAGLERYLTKRGIDPREGYVFGSYWIEDLNE